MNKVIMYGLIYKNGMPHATFSAPYIVNNHGEEEFDLPMIADEDSDNGDLYYIDILEVVSKEDEIDP